MFAQAKKVPVSEWIGGLFFFGTLFGAGWFVLVVTG